MSIFEAKRPILRVLLVIAFIVCAEEGVRLFTPPSEFESMESHICMLCGVQRHISKNGPVNDPSKANSLTVLVRTPLSQWYGDHFDKDCLHKWRRNHIWRQTYASLLGVRWRCVGQAGSGITPMLVDLNEKDRESLDRLFSQDPESCRDYLMNQMDRESF